MEKKKGRPTKYNPLYHPKMAELAARNGLTNPEIADELGVSTSSIDMWLKVHPAFSSALKKGREDPDNAVEASLFQKATGWVNKNAVKVFYDSKTGEPVYAPYEEHQAPDTAAAFIWLKNRRPDKWRDRVENHHSGKIELDQLTPEERKKRIAELQKKLKK